MTELLRLIFSRLRWFLGTVIVLLILVLFLWNIFDREGLVVSMQGLLDDVQAICHYLLYYAIIAGIVYLVFKAIWRGIFPKPKKGHH